VRIERKFVAGAALAVAVIAIAAWRIGAASTRTLGTRYPLPANPLTVTPAPEMAKDGARLAHLNGCFSCHGADLAGRVIFTGWFGTRIVAPNLTRLARHRTDAELALAIRFGLKPDRTSLIDMPSARYVKSSDGDVAAIIAYLRTLPERPDTAPKPRWRFGGRALLAMKLLPVAAPMVDRSARGPIRTPTAPRALGHYLTQSQCAVCHGPDLAGEPEEDSPSLRFSIRHYSLGVFERFFATGRPRKGHGTQTMTPLIKRRLHYLTKADIRAIYVYLNTKKRNG